MITLRIVPRNKNKSNTKKKKILSRPVRTKRVREARDEAKQEIAEYKAKKEDEFKKFEAEVRALTYLRLAFIKGPICAAKVSAR